MGHWSLQIALRMMPGPLLGLNAVIKLFPPQQEFKLASGFTPLVVNMRRNQEVVTLTGIFFL